MIHSCEYPFSSQSFPSDKTVGLSSRTFIVKNISNYLTNCRLFTRLQFSIGWYDIRRCESGCAYHVSPTLTNTLMKVQHVAVSENSVHNSCCVSVSTAQCRAHTHLYITLQRTCVTCPTNCHLHSQWARLRHTKVACHIHVSFAPALTETRQSGSLFLFYLILLVAEPRSSASGLDRSTQQGELRSSAMSGGTDRREDEQVPQFNGRIDEKFSEWEIDVRLWQVAFKVDDRDRRGPRLYRRGLHG